MAMTGGLENDGVLVDVEDVPCTPSINESVSAITDTLGSPTVLERPLTETEIGLPTTPEVNVPFIFDASVAETGYDSSGELGPVRNTPGMDPDVNRNEEEVVAGDLEENNGNSNDDRGMALTNEINRFDVG